MARFWDLVGGHPFLVRRGLDEMVTQGLDLALLDARAAADDGAFAGHLERLLVSLSRDASLTDAVRGLLRGTGCQTQSDFFRLRSAGVLAGATPKDAHFRCRLYADFLGRHLT